MKLSLKPGRGATHVGGGRVLVVATSHPVSTATRSVHAERPETDRYRKPWLPPPVEPLGKTVDCQVGDLAIEMVYPKTGKLVGYSYLSGPAIQLNHYVDAPSDGWFYEVPAGAEALVIPKPSEFPTVNSWFNSLIEATVAARFGPAAVYAFEVKAEASVDTEELADVILKAWGYVPKEMSDEEVDAKGRSHMLGLVRTGKTVAEVHAQPKHHASDWNATGFQIALVLDAIKTGRAKRIPGDA